MFHHNISQYLYYCSEATFETQNHSKPWAYLLDIVGPWAALGDLAQKSLLVLTGFRRIFQYISWLFLSTHWMVDADIFPVLSTGSPKNRLYKAHPLTRHEPSEGFQIFSIVGDTNWSLYKYLIPADTSPLSHGPTAWRKVCCSSKTLRAVTLQRPSSDYAVAMWEVRFGCRWLEDVNELNMQQLYFIDNSMLVLRTGGITLVSR